MIDNSTKRVSAKANVPDMNHGKWTLFSFLFVCLFDIVTFPLQKKLINLFFVVFVFSLKRSPKRIDKWLA